ncbi:hypothetical protein SNE40_020669 [Patella caerulea]|uniref:CxC5 like cysteine cluster associated with KDZ domain-containing protein n=3 Tax=Patella caerulea TaxID=87958 RepID=A0AAN8J4U1_PATCE
MPPKKRNRISEITADVDVTFQKIEEMLEEVEVDDLLNRRAHLMCYLYLKYGSRDVDRILRTMAKVPKILPSKLFSDICESHCQVQDEALPRLFSLLKDEYGATIETPSEDLCVVSPPTAVCLMGCKDRYGERKKLEVHHKLSQIRYLSFAGISVKQKCCLRCKLCRTNYNVNMFGDKTNGFKLYDDRRDFIEASDEYLVDRNVFNLQWALAQHCWVSFEGFAESLSDGFGMLNGSQDLIDRKLVANCFWWGELEEELREEKKDVVFFNRNDRELCMRKIETDRCKSLYHHAAIDCTEECKARGCGKLWVTDGLWKLQFAHCMFHKQNTVDGVPLINFPDVCTEEPEPGSAFCPDHFKLMEKSKIPTSLKGFLKYAGVIRESAVIDEDIENQPLSEDAQSKISRVFCNLKTAPNQGQSVIETQGGLEFVSDQSKSIPEISSACAPDVQRDNTCTKDLGERRVLRKLSRGHQFVIRGGGHIDMWTPLYRSESMGQVFIFILSWLYLTVRNIPIWCFLPQEFHKILDL